MKLMMSEMERTERIADMLVLAGAVLRALVLPLGDKEIVTAYTEDGMTVNVCIPSAGPVRMNCQLMDTFAGETERMLEWMEMVPLPEGIQMVLENDRLYLETAVERDEGMTAAAKDYFRKLSMLRPLLLQALDGVEEQMLFSERVRQTLLEEKEDFLADRYQGGGWDFSLYDPEEMVDVFIGPDGYGFVRFLIQGELGDGLWPEIPDWILEMSREAFSVELTLDGENWWVDVEGCKEFQLIGDETDDADTIRFSLEEAREICYGCRKRVTAFLTGAA